MPNQFSEKLPPQNIEAEQSVLGCLLIDKNAIVRVIDFLQSRDFYKIHHQEIFQAMFELFERGEPIDLLSISSRLKEKNKLEEIGGTAYLTDLVNTVPTAAHTLNYAKIVQHKRILRDLIEASFDISQMGYNESEDVDVLLDQAERKVFSITQKSLTQKFLPIKDSLEEAFERIDRLSRHEGGPRGVPTGFADLDYILSGLQKSDLVILASRPSMGKSSLALDFAKYVSVHEHLPVGIFSLEMSMDQVVDRLISSQAGVDLWKIRTGTLSSKGDDNDFTKIQSALGVLAEAPIYIDDAATANVLQMRAMARRLQADKGLGMLVIDYLQLIEPRTQESMVQQITEISRSLKGLARELNVPVLAISQLSRAVEQRSPQIPRLADLRESGCLAGETLITRADTGERIQIKNLVGQTDIPVFSLDETWKVKKTKASKIFSSGQKMVYELTTRSGFKIKASANHPFRKLEGWQRLDGLKIGDSIATPRKISLSQAKNELSKEEITLLAHLLGDGCVLPRQPVHYTSADPDNLKIVSEAARKLFGIKSRLVRQKNWWHLYLPSPYHLTHRKHHPITNWYRSLGLQSVHSWEKEIPEKVFCLDDENTALFLRHLWATDGNISFKYLKGRKPSGNIYYSTTSEKLARGVKYLLLRLGIRSRISGVKKENYRLCYNISVQGKEDQIRFLREVGVFGDKAKIVPKLTKYLEVIDTNPNVDVIPKEIWGQIGLIKNDYNLSWRDFAENYGMSYCGSSLFDSGVSRARLTKIVDFMPEINLKNLSESEVFWDEIVSITPLGVEEVYDATVPGVHNFVANDIVVHNSLEQDADVVLFIYREDRYRPESEKKNIADIIIAKHRNGPVGKVELYFDEQIASFRNLAKEEREFMV